MNIFRKSITDGMIGLACLKKEANVIEQNELAENRKKLGKEKRYGGQRIRNRAGIVNHCKV